MFRLAASLLCTLMVLSGDCIAAIPFLHKGGLIFVEATIPGAGRALRLIVDSGAEESVLARRTVEELGIPYVSSEQILGVNGLEMARRSAPTAIHLDGSRVFTKKLLVLDLQSESRALGTSIDGLLGMDFFEDRVVRVHFDRRQIELASHSQPSAGALVLPLSRNHRAICVSARVDGVSLPRLRVDTGCTEALRWTVPSESGLKRPWRNGSKREVSLSLGSHSLPELTSRAYREPIFPAEDGLLGMGVLDRFRSVSIDAVRHRLILERG